MDFIDWSISIKIQMIYLSICISIPSMALYIAEIVTIVRHKKFHNSFYALFVMRAISDLLYVLTSFYGIRMPSIFGGVLYPIYSKFPNWMLAMSLYIYAHTFQANNLVTAFILLNRLTAIIMPIKYNKIWLKFLPFITIFVYAVPALSYWPMFKMNTTLRLNNPNSTTDLNFFVHEAGDAPYLNYIINICAVFSAIFMIVCVLINICTFVSYKLHMKKVSTNGSNSDDIKKKLLVYAIVTFLGHLLLASLYLIAVFTKMTGDTKITAATVTYYPLIMDTGTVVLSSWLLLWASGTFRQQLIKDYTIICITNRTNILVGTIEGPRNNNNWAVRGAVGHHSLPTIS